MALFSFLFFTGLVAGLTWLLTHRSDHATSEGYFLAGRSLSWPFIAGSLLLTNLSTEQMVGLNGSAFTDGLAVMAWEVVAVLALVAMALFFLPRFLQSGVTTVPEYLAQRFDHHTRSICTLIFLSAYALILLPIILYTGATGLMGILDIQTLLGIESRGGYYRFDLCAVWRPEDCRRLRHPQQRWPVGRGINDHLVWVGGVG
jgi:SSS family solute:Na+ symporter